MGNIAAAIAVLCLVGAAKASAGDRGLKQEPSRAAAVPPVPISYPYPPNCTGNLARDCAKYVACIYARDVGGCIDCANNVVITPDADVFPQQCGPCRTISMGRKLAQEAAAAVPPPQRAVPPVPQPVQGGGEFGDSIKAVVNGCSFSFGDSGQISSNKRTVADFADGKTEDLPGYIINDAFSQADQLYG